MIWTDLMQEINGNPLLALGFYGFLGIVVGIPMKLTARFLTRVPPTWINKDTAPAMVAFPTLIAAWFLIRLVPALDDNALFVALGMGGGNTLIGRRLLTPVVDGMEKALEPKKENPDG